MTPRSMDVYRSSPLVVELCLFRNVLWSEMGSKELCDRLSADTAMVRNRQECAVPIMLCLGSLGLVPASD